MLANVVNMETTCLGGSAHRPEQLIYSSQHGILMYRIITESRTHTSIGPRFVVRANRMGPMFRTMFGKVSNLLFIIHFITKKAASSLPIFRVFSQQKHADCCTICFPFVSLSLKLGENK